MPVDDDVLRARISEVKLAIKELQRITSKHFSELNIDERYSMRYNLVVLVESLVSLCVHLTTEAYDLRPTSYKEAISIVAEKLGLKCVEDLKSLVSLRNLLIHRYWTVDDERVYQEVKNDFECIYEFLGGVEGAFLS